MNSKYFPVYWALAVASLLIPNTVTAQPNFSLCDGLKGAAWGLCRGGVAVGCDTDEGPAEACAVIESNFIFDDGLGARATLGARQKTMTKIKHDGTVNGRPQRVHVGVAARAERAYVLGNE